MFFILFISVLLISVKCLTSLNFNYYGAYYFPLPALCVFSMLYDYALRRGNEKSVKICFSILFAILFFSFAVSNIERRNAVFDAEIKTEKGIIYVESSKAPAVRSILEFISRNTAPSDKILVLPEGAIINFLSGRKSDNKYFYLIPPNIEVFKENNIVNDLKNSMPEYIIWQPVSYNNFQENFFCGSFGRKICSLLPEYYEKPVVFGADFYLAVYKKKMQRG